MKGKKLAVLAAVVTISISIFYLSFTRLKPAHADNGLLLSLIMGGIHEVHYSPQSVDDAFSEKIFSEYLSRVDYNKKIFTQKDIDEKKVNLLFFGNFYKMGLNEFAGGMLKMMGDREFLYGSLIRDVYSQGIVLGRKYKILRVAYNVFMYGLIISVIAFVVATLIT